MAILNQTLRSIELPPEQTAHTGGKGIAERADLTGTDPDLSQTRWGIDWRPNNAPEFTWYSDDPEILGPSDGGGHFLFWTSHVFRKPTTRWMRLYVYHLAKVGSHRVRVGVYNRADNKPIWIHGAKLRATKAFKPGDDSGRRVMSNLAALSVDQVDLAYDDVISEAIPYTGSSEEGWTIVDDFSANQGYMLHRIYELCIEPVADNVIPKYFVAAFTSSGENIEPRRSGSEPYIADDQTFPATEKHRRGLYRYSYLIQAPERPIDVTSPKMVAYLRISPKRHALGALAGERITGGKTLLGNYPAWTETQVRLLNRNQTASRVVQLWLDALNVGGDGYWGAVKFLGSSETDNYGLVPGNTVIIPPIKWNSPNMDSSALLDRFVVPASSEVVRRYRFMHGGASTLELALLVDARSEKAGGRPNIGFPEA